MKRKFSFLFVFVLIISMLPISVFAGGPVELDVRVYNRTGAPISLKLTSLADGAISWVQLPANESIMALTEGKYEYYAVTKCGTQFGIWNVNVVKELLLKCEDDKPAISLSRACPDNLYGHYWYATAPGEQSWVFVPWDILNVPDTLGGSDWQDGGIDCWSNKDQHWPGWLLDLFQ